MMVSLQPWIMNLSLAIDRFENKCRFIDIREGLGFFYYYLCDYMRVEGRELAISSHYLPK